MKMATYKSRREQIEKNILLHLVQDIEKFGITVAYQGKEKFHKLLAGALRTAATIGAAEERQHCLRLIRDKRAVAPASAVNGALGELDNDICRKSVLDVLGYEEKAKE